MAHCKPDGAAEQSSKIEPRADRDRTRKDTSCIACDSAETGRVDVRIRIAPNRTVQQIDRIRSNRKCFGFGNLDPFAQGGAEPHVSRFAEPTVTAVAGGIGLWSLRNHVAVTIVGYLVRKT